MHQPLVPMLFSILGAHVSGAGFMYPDQNWKEMCGMLANLVADSGAGKGCKDFAEYMFRPWLKTNSEDRRNGLGGYGRERAWRLWRNKPGWHGETGLEAMEK